MDLLLYNKNFRIRSALLTETADACQKLLKNSPLAENSRIYLNSRISRYNQDKFKFGWFPPNDHLDLLIDLVGKSNLLKLELIYENPFVNIGVLNNHNLTFPCHDEFGNLIALVGRTVLPEKDQKELKLQKYKYTSGKSSLNRFIKSDFLFGLDKAKRAIRVQDCVIVVEGQIDAISCHAAGFHNIVALGGSSLSFFQLFLLLKYTNNIFLLLDSDQAGITATEKILTKYGKFAKFKTISLPAGYKDVDRYVHESNDFDIFNLKG